jgi:tetratricopeptide (TPR) repeat protein
MSTDNREVWLLAKERSFDEVLDRLRNIEQERNLSPGELVLKARCFQLSEKRGSLADAQGALERALEIDPYYVPALMDLAWFHHAVEDDSGKALGLFEKVVALARQQVVEAVVGKARCLDELSSRDEADRFVKEMEAATLLSPRTDWEAWSDWSGMQVDPDRH